jgi:ArsR family transcriptional regulator, arsenate/arsenite/antimonite-responsive transcriptional repressor
MQQTSMRPRDRQTLIYMNHHIYWSSMDAADKFYVALNDCYRRRILALLLQENEVCVCEMVEVLRLPQPKVSRHLAVLRDARIVTVRRSGTWIFYRICPDTPLWIYKSLELMAHGSNKDPAFAGDAARLKRRAVRHAEIDREQRKAPCACRQAPAAS